MFGLNSLYLKPFMYINSALEEECVDFFDEYSYYKDISRGISNNLKYIIRPGIYVLNVNYY